MERRVVLLTKDPGLASIADRLLSNGDRVAHFRTAAELKDWSRPTVAAVVLDSQPHARRLSYKQVRDRYHGPLVMLLDKGERRPDLPPDGARQFLYRPFKSVELSRLLAAPPAELRPFEAAIIGAWSRHATTERSVRVRRGPSYRINWRPSLRRRARAWAATVVALMGLLLVFSLSDQSPCTPGCTSFGGGAVAGASEIETPLTLPPAGGSGGGGSRGRPPGLSAASSEPPTPTGGGLPLVSGVGGLIQSISPITGGDTSTPSGPSPVAGVPAPPGTSTPGTAPPTTAPPTTAPPTTAPPTTTPPTTDPPTTDPPTTDPPTTAPPPTDPPTTAPPPTDPPTTAPPPTDPPTTAPPPTEPPTTAPPTTAAATTAGPTTT